jgi:hypothetical protein
MKVSVGPLILMQRGWFAARRLVRLPSMQTTLSLLFGVMMASFVGHSTLPEPGSQAELSDKQKYRLLKSQITRRFLLSPIQNDREVMTAVVHAISRATGRTGVDLIEVRALAKKIIHVSKCFGIDPIHFAALIWRESRFDQTAQSPTGAIGITQMTYAGIEEVLDRLALGSHRRFGALRAQVASCQPGFLEHVPTEVTAEALAHWHDRVETQLDDALVMGAILFKLDLASAESIPARPMRELYRTAFENYNGEAGFKSQFAEEVLALSQTVAEFGSVLIARSGL